MKIKAIIDFCESWIGFDGAPVSSQECLIRYYVEVEKLPEITATERAEKEVASLLRKLSDHIDQVESTSNLPVLRVIDEVSGRISGSCWSSSGISIDEVIRNKCLSSIPKVIKEIQSLTPNEFEHFCAAFLAILGASKTKVTPRSGDGGIDFYGWLHLGSFLPGEGGFAKLADKMRFYFAGQAKHYPGSRIGPSVVRELVGAVSLARYGVSSSGQEFFEGIRFKALDPLVVLLITTGAFSKGARELAINSGIFPLDVGQIALYLAAKRIGFLVSDQDANFSRLELDAWITKHANYELTPPLSP